MSLNHNTILIIAHLCVVCFGEDMLPAYEYYAKVKGWLSLHTEPADWETATSICQSENAVLASPWTAAFSSAINSLQSGEEQSLSVLYSGLHSTRTLPSLNGEQAPWLESSELERCGVFYANGSSGEVGCGQRLPYVCFARVVAVPSLGCGEGRPGYKYRAPLHGWLKLHQQPADWQAARVRCHLEGAFLASPWSTEFSSAILEIQSSNDGQTNKTIPVLYSGVHILTTATFSEGVYTNVKGKAAISLEPSELARTERCGVFYANGTTGEVSCTEELLFVCYAPAPTREHAPTYTPTSAPTSTTTLAPTSTTTLAPTSTPTLAPTSTTTLAPTSTTTLAPTSTTTLAPTSTTTLAPTSTTTLAPTSTTTPATTSTTTPAPTPAPAPCCGEKSLGYDLFHNDSFFDSNGRCYKFHVQAATWTDAYNTCVKEGARLAAPNSEDKRKILVELFKCFPDDAIHGAHSTTSVFNGIYWESGAWWTVDDPRSGAQAGHKHWGSEQSPYEEVLPYAIKQNGGVVFGYRYWNSPDNCPFICEMAPAPLRG